MPEMLDMSDTVLLIDDVFTTGSTLRACAAVLKQAGAKQVFALTIGLAGQNVDENEAESPERIAALGQI